MNRGCIWAKRISVLLLMVFSCSGAVAQTVVSSFAALKPYLDDNDVNVVMTPGTYRITPADVTSGLFPDAHLLEFSGANSVFDFTDVTFEVETEVFQSFGSVDVREIVVMGDDLVLSNLTLIDIGTTKPTKRAQSVLLDGRRNLVEGFNLSVRGSYPYGYGDIFGKGGGPVISHQKHSAILVRGIENHLKDCKIFHRSYGHGIFCQGSQNAIIEGCYVEGEMRTSDDVLAEAGSGSAADNVAFLTTWGYTLQPGWMFSCQEAGIRAYNTGLSIDGVNSTNTTDIRVIDCTVNNMRTGVNIGFCNDMKYVRNCVVIGVESGYWLGTEGEIVDSAGNASFGPLLVNNYSNDRDSVADLTVLDNKDRYGNELVAYITGARDDVTFRCRDEYIDANLVIKVSGIRTGIRQHIINPTYNDLSATDAVLHNYTQLPVEMGTKSTGTSGQTGGSVVDYGTGNSLAPISVGTCGGFSVIQTIEAEDFCGQSGVSIQTRGDGLRYTRAVNDGDWIRFDDFFMGSGPNRFEARVAGGPVGGDIELRLDSAGGELIGTCLVTSNAGPHTWNMETITLDEPRGKRDLYLVFKGTAGSMPGLDRFRFYVEFPGWETAKGLVGHWKFDDGSGTAATDSSGYGHHGTVTNAAWVNGKKGGALDFDGSSSSVSIPTNAFDSIREEISIAMWVYGDDAQPLADSVFYAVDASDHRVLNIHLPYSNSSNYWDAGFEGSSYDRIFKGTTSGEFEGSWSHWVITKNAKTGNMRIYRNGAMWHAGAGKTKPITGITSAAIGNKIDHLSYDGMIDDVRLYDVELMTHEVAELYNSYSYTDAGTPHSWLDAHGLVVSGDYAAADLQDADGDGPLSGEEYRAGTNPTNGASVFYIIDAEAQGDDTALDWSPVTGKIYDVWFKGSLVDDAWTLKTDGIPGADPSCSSTVYTGGASGFLHVEAIP